MIEYQLDPTRRIITTRVTGAVSFGELANYIHQLVRDPDFKADFHGLIVAVDLAAVPAPSTVGTLAPLVRAWSSRRKGVKWAFVLPTAESKAFAERALQEVAPTGVTTKCFLTEAAGRTWLEGSTDRKRSRPPFAGRDK